MVYDSLWQFFCGGKGGVVSLEINGKIENITLFLIKYTSYFQYLFKIQIKNNSLLVMGMDKIQIRMRLVNIRYFRLTILHLSPAQKTIAKTVTGK